MSSLTSNPATLAPSPHRVRITTEAVLSAYIREITPTQPLSFRSTPAEPGC